MSDDKNGAAQVIDKTHAACAQEIVKQLQYFGKVVDGDWSAVRLPVTQMPTQDTAHGGSAALPVMLSSSGGSGSRGL